MTAIGGAIGVASGVGDGSSPAMTPAAANGELAKLHSQLADWVNCPSCKTSAGKAKIAEISSKIEALENRVKKAEVNKHSSAVSSPAAELIEAPTLRFDGLGAFVSLRA